MRFYPRALALLICGVMLAGLSGCAGVKVVRIPVPVPVISFGGNKEKPAQAKPAKKAVSSNVKTEYGTASWYGKDFHRRRTASGEYFNMYDLTAAHPNLPFGSQVRVTNMENGRECVVRINDRGPFKDGRVIDLSLAAARELDFERQGLCQVKIEAY